jgi:uncharacterized membrane protein
MSTPGWALSLAYWAHMLATVIWIGGLTALVLFVLPVGQRRLDAQAYADLLDGIQHRLDSLGWFSVVVLLGSGMLQMSANPNYSGVLAISNPWSTVILIKHLLFIVMLGVSAYLTWGITPELRRAAIRRARGISSAELDKLQHRETILLRLNLGLGILVLALTAIARAS